MYTEYYKEYSYNLDRDMEFKVYGHAGIPFIVFPCQNGKFYDFENRKALIDKLSELDCVKHIYPTDANFVLVRVDDADALYSHLRSHGIIVRNRNRVEKCLGCLRITVGTCNENDQLINAMLKYEKR